MYVRCTAGEPRNEWTDVFNAILSEHQQNRFAGHEAVLLAFSNSLRYYDFSVAEKSLIEADGDANVNYCVLKKIVTQYIRQKEVTMFQDLEMIIGIHDVERNVKHHHYYKI